MGLKIKILPVRSVARLPDGGGRRGLQELEDYAQASLRFPANQWSSRIVTTRVTEPLMGEVDMVPDDDLNTRLKFYCVRTSWRTSRTISWRVVAKEAQDKRHSTAQYEKPLRGLRFHLRRTTSSRRKNCDTLNLLNTSTLCSSLVEIRSMWIFPNPPHKNLHAHK